MNNTKFSSNNPHEIFSHMNERVAHLSNYYAFKSLGEDDFFTPEEIEKIKNAVPEDLIADDEEEDYDLVADDEDKNK